MIQRPASHAATEPLNPLRFPLWGSRLIEASAGTGKTYTIASLYVRLVLGHDMEGRRSLTPPEILVVTFTRAATDELRDRIRARLTEAAACFLEETEGDTFLQELRADFDSAQWPSCAHRLNIAAEWMDDAAVSTIDAWCYRILREHAFDSASLFNVEMDIDAAETVAEATRDYWRMFVAPLPPDAFTQVSSVFRSCEALASDLHRRWLPKVSLLQGAEHNRPAELAEKVKQALAACKRPWMTWCDEIRQILLQAYEDGLYNKAKLRKNHWEGWLDKLTAWAADPDALLPFPASQAGWDKLTPAGLREVWKDAGTVPAHPGLEDMLTLRDRLLTLSAELERACCHAAVWVAGRTAELRRRRAMLDFNGLLEQLDAALQGPNGARLAGLIRQQFPAALIDEFQDTNPVQYRIFDRIYGVAANKSDALLALIGDPKQAIYAFRGADIHAYLQARYACEGRIYTLTRNFRSSGNMVAAVNHLFLWAETHQSAGAFLFRRNCENGAELNPVPFQPVEAARDPGDFLVEGKAQTALTIWCNAEAGFTDEHLAAACASEVLRLLLLAQQGKAGFQGSKGFLPLQPRDIAILVNTHRQADSLAQELRKRGIRSVYLSEKASVYTSASARELLAWLRACAEPEKGAYVRAALATASLGLSWHALDALVHDEAHWEAMLERFAVYKEDWRLRGVLPMLRRFMHEFGVPARLFSKQETGGTEGERQLTDLLHLAELLQAASSSLDGEHALIRFLEEQIAAGRDADADGDVSRLRLESDAGLVQIVTVHKSKGLEYPLVFFPYGHYSRVNGALELPATWHDESGALHMLSCKADADPETLQSVQYLLERERLAEDLRKLYVALTRSRHACWMGVSAGKQLDASAMGYILGPSSCQAQFLEGALQSMAASCAAITIDAFPSPLTGYYRSEVSMQGKTPVWRTMSRRIEQAWQLSSYSALSRMAMGAHAEDAPGLDISTRLAMPDEARLDNFLEAYAAEEPVADPSSLPWLPPTAAEPGLHGFPKGAAAGSFLHELIEWVFRQGPRTVLADPDTLRDHVQRRCRSRGWAEHGDVVTRWLEDFLTRPFELGDNTPSLILSQLGNKLPEMEFWFGIEQLRLPDLDALVGRYFLPGKPRAQITHGHLRGLLRGFVDLVFEHEGRYYVADYKSNWLGPSDAHYTAQAVQASILGHRYDLQLALYLYALHSLLQTRLGSAYDYERHIGGGLIFFLRGSRAPTQGLHIERPPKAVMEQMVRLFNDGSAEDQFFAASEVGGA
ncbi:MAG TPA: exodeoxyribonuclease V subunit beta [Burkholderiaceae bacterium]|nr:exodeoxyribonuclease V subunit beta [Burkholderiaceae bacterium]